jgi:hypothetical protein
MAFPQGIAYGPHYAGRAGDNKGENRAIAENGKRCPQPAQGINAGSLLDLLGQYQ